MFFIYMAIFTLLFGIAGTIARRRNNRLKTRLIKFLPRGTMLQSKEEKLNDETEKVLFLSRISQPFRNWTMVSRWSDKLEEAGLQWKPEKFFVIRLLFIFGMSFLMLLLGFDSILIIIAAGALGYYLPIVYVKTNRTKRMHRCADQLQTTIGTISTSLKAGFSFLQAMQVVSREVGDPIGTEFKQALVEMRLGVSTDQALKNIVKRLPNEDLELVIKAFLIQRNTGGNLTEILETIDETISERLQIKQQVKTLTAQGKLSAWIISLLPFVLGILLHLIDPLYFSPMLSHPLGWVMIGAGLFSGVVGFLLIQKIVSVQI